MTLTFGSLFAGIGGFDAGFEAAGLRCAWQVEIDPACQNVLRRHFPDALLLSDVRECGAHNLPRVDIITFGSPCQDLSIAGKRKGLGGERSGLFFEAVRIIRELRPAVAVWENVPGALSSNGGRDFGAVLDALAQSGALDIGWAVLDAQWFGVAQRRRRVFVVADFGAMRAGEILAIPYGSKGDTPPRREAGEEDPAFAGTLSANRGGTERPAGNANELDFCVPVAPPITASGRGTERAGESRVQDCVIPVAFGGGNTSGPVDVATTCNAHGRRHDFESETFISFSAGNSGDSYGIAADENVTPPVRAGASGTNQAPTVAQVMGVRRLMPVECERLQGFPDDWTAWGITADGKRIEQSDSARYRQLGNAVCRNVAEWIGRRIEDGMR